MLADAEKAKSKAVTAAEKLGAVRQAKKYRRMVEELSKPDEAKQAKEQTIQDKEPTDKAKETASAQTEAVETAPKETFDDRKFAEQPELNGNHEGMTAVEQADGTYKWVGLQRSEVTEGMSEREVAVLDEFAKRMGLPIVAVDIADGRFNGMYRDGVVYINPNRDKQWTMRWVAGHELLHDVEKLSPETYNAYKEAVKALWGDAYFEDKVKDTMDIYAEAGHPIDREQAEREVVNDFGGDLFSSRDGMKIMQGILDKASREGKPEFVKRLMEWWDRIKEFFKGSPYYADVQKAMEKAYADAMKNANERLQAEDGRAEMSAKKRRALETVPNSRNEELQTVGSSTLNAKSLEDYDAIKPIGKSSFGNVYNQFRGNAIDAFRFLKLKQKGDLQGVFHKDDIGDIDVVWGDKGGGFEHILGKHIGDGKSFANIEEAAKAIDNIIHTGKNDFDNGDKIVFKKDGKLVTIRKNVREHGKKIADKNWILTAYDELSADGDVSAIAPVNQGQAARTTDNSHSKDTANILPEQEFSIKSSKEEDKAYLEAVKRGDMETAQRMVNEAAERAGYSTNSDYQGTSAFNGAAPYGNDWFVTKEERKQAWDNDEWEGYSTLGDYIDNGVDGGNIEELTNGYSYRSADDMRREAIENLRDVIDNGKKTITMYRSVPASVKEGKFRNGDWVTPSRKYAVDNAEIHGWEDGYRIIKQEVPVDDVWFDGNDIAEFGYGRDKDYANDRDFAYKNTKNNRKLLDAVTYDDNGEVIPLSQRFNPRKADERYSIKSDKKEDRTLAGVHNITEEKLRKALKLGGLANPSVAVIDTSKNGHENFGEISLILPSDKVAKRTGKNAGTWQGDAWTPTYPQVERKMSNAGAEKLSKDVSSVPNDMYGEVSRGFDRWMDSGEANSAMAYMFLLEKGVAPETKKTQQRFSDEIYNKLRFITAGDFNIYGIGKEDAKKVLEMYIDAKFDGNKDLYEEKTKSWLERNKSVVDAGTKLGLRYTIAKENVELYDEYGFNYKGVQAFVRDVASDHRNGGKLDTYATLKRVDKYIADHNLNDELNRWVKDKEKQYGVKEVIFDGFTSTGRRRYVDNTIENVSKLMKKQGRNGATGFGFSFNNFAANLMPSFSKLDDIRAKKGLLTDDPKKREEFQDKWGKVFSDLAQKCQPDAKSVFDDYGMGRLTEAAMQKDPQAYLKKEYNVDFSDEDVKRLKEMIKAVKEEYPSMYFETKFERPVYLKEFASAVVPNDLSADVKKAIENSGIALYEYDAKKEGDRSRAFDEAVNNNDDILFSIKKSGDQAEYSVKKENTDEERKITPVGEREKALRDAVIGRMRKSGIDVIDNDTEGQRVLDMVNGRGEPMRSQAMLSSLAKAANTIHGWLATGNRGKSFTIELPESTRRMIRKVMGRDFESHNITANGVAHAQKNHGVEGNKISERSIPLREQDMELIPYIMVAPDYVRKGSEDVTGRTSVRFYKELSNGYVVVAEKEYKNSPDDMETITMWAEMSDKATNAQRTAAPDTHVQNAILDIDVAKIRKDAEDAIKNDNKVKKHRVYHGSGADFEAFDHSHMGEGEGAQAYGWGTYVTEVEGIGRTYAIQNSRHPRAYYEYKGDTHGLSKSRINEILEVFMDGKPSEDFIVYEFNDALDWYGSKPEEYFKFLVRDASLLNPSDIVRVEDKPRNLYTVDIPEDNGSNYLDWQGRISDIPKDAVEGVIRELVSKGWSQSKDGTITRLERDGKSVVINKNATGADLYEEIASAIGPKKASKLLSDVGFTGIKYPAEARSGGRKDGAKNYVIFNESDAKITDHVRFFRTADGEAYGFTVGGKVYIDPRIATAETPVHEYTHLWSSALRTSKPNDWQRVVGLMKDTAVWEEVKSNYKELKTDDDIADEVLAQFSGKRGAERLRAEMQKAKGDAKDVAENALNKVKQALADFWKGVCDMLGVKYTSADDVADKVLSDLLEGVNPTDPDGGGKRPDESIIDYAKRKAEEYSIKKSFGGNSGYVGYSKSKRAVDAEDRGLRSVSNMDREFAEEVSEIVSRESGKEAKVSLAEVKRIAKDMRGDEWHHTSKYGNRTQYYSAESIAERILADREPKSEELVADDKERESALERVRDMLVTDKDVKTKVVDRGRETEYTDDVFTSSNGYQIVVGKGMFDEKRTFSNTQFLNNGKVGKRELYLPEWYVDDHIDVLQKAMDEYNARLDDALGKEAQYSIQSEAGSKRRIELRKYDRENNSELIPFLEYVKYGNKGKDHKKTWYKVGVAGELLNKYGISGDMNVSTKALNPNFHTNDDLHKLTPEEWTQVMYNINTPLGISSYSARGKADEYRLFTTIQRNGKNICVGIRVKKQKNGNTVSDIVTAFGRDISTALKNENFVYKSPELEKIEKEQKNGQSSPLHNPQVYDQSSTLGANVDNNSEPANKIGEEFSIKGGKSLDERLNSKYVRTRYNAAKEMCRGNGQALDILADTTPQTLEELIAESLSGANGVKLLWDDNGVKRGLKAHLGYGNMERRMMSGFLSPDGISPEHFAEQLEASAEHLGIEHGDTMDIFNKVLDTVAGRSKRELGDLLLNNRIDRALDVVRKQEEWNAEQEQEYLDTLLPAMREEYLAQKAELEAVKWMPEKEKAKYLADKRRERMLAEMSDAEREEVLAKQRWNEDNKYILSDAFRRERSDEPKAAKSKLQEKYDTLKTSFDKLLKQQSERATRDAISGKEDKERIKDSTRKEEADKVREIADQMREFIEQAVPKDMQDDMTRFDFKGVLKALDTATTTKDLEKPMRTVDEIGTYLASRALNKQLGAILGKKYKSTNAKGVAVARAVDNSTRVVMDYAKQLYREMGNTGVSQQLFGLRLDRKDIMDEMKALAKSTGDADISAMVESVEKVMKAKQDKRKAMLTELRDEMSVETASKVGGYIDQLLETQEKIDSTIAKGEENISKAPENAVESLKTLAQEIGEREDAGTMSEDDRAMQKSFYNLESFGFYKTSLA